jgi:hypothetical protein
MKQIWPNYSYSPTTNVLTLTGLNIDRDQLLLVTAADRGRIMYNFADSSVTASAFTSGANTALTLVATTAGLTTTAALVIYYDDQVAGISGTVTVGNSVTISSLPAISGTVTANVFGTNGYFPIPLQMASNEESFTNGNRLAVSIVNNEGYEYTTPLPISVNGVPNDNGIPYFGVGYFTSPGSSLIQVSQDPNCGLPINGTVTANTFAVQGTAVTTSNFTSTAPSTVLANFNAGREVLTIFNEGAGNLHICAGATCTTIAYQVRLSAGDYYEVPNHQTTITHSAVFATAGTARVCQVS